MNDAYQIDLPVEPGPPSVVGIMLRWLLGPAIFVAHLAAFLAAGAAMLAIDLLQDPGAIWSTAVLLRWAVVVGVHALVATIGWAVALVIDAAHAAGDEGDFVDAFAPTASAADPAPSPAPAPATVAIDWSEHVAPNLPATALPGSRLPSPGVPATARTTARADDAVEATPDADSVVLERSAPYDPLPAPVSDALLPAPPEPVIPAGAPPRARFSPPVVTPAAPEPVEGHKPRWYDRHRRREDVAAPAPDSAERTPPGWRVITPATEPAPAAPLPPSPATAKPGDESWTWIEAAAQAWLEHRAEATGTTGRPAQPAADATDPPSPTLEDASDDRR